jgi:hypothetical protein
MTLDACPRALTRLLAATLLCAATAAAAADPAPPKGNVLKLGKGQPTGKLLTRDELRHCLKEEAGLKTQGEQVKRSRVELDAEQAQVERDEQALGAERAAIDASDAAAVDAFNVKLGALRDRSAAYKARALAYNGEADAYNTRQQGWAGQCADRPYDERDYFAIQRGK